LLKVLHVIPSVAQRYGGPSQVIYTMCRALQSQGVDPLIVTTNADGNKELPVALATQVNYQNVPTIFFARQFSEALKYSRPLAQWLDRHVAGFDLVHIHAVFSHACMTAAKACQKHQVPYIVRPLGTLNPWGLNQKPLRKELFWHLAVQRMLHRAAIIHYTTNEEKHLAETALGLANGVVIPNGIDLDKTLQYSDRNESAEYPMAAPYVMALSRIHPVKGYELLIEAFAALKKQGRFNQWQLVIAGDGEATYVDQLKTLAERHGLNDDVRFVGWLEGESKYTALNGASLLALPSYQENFGISLIEAMACGVPVLVSPHVNLAPEIAAANAGWVTPQNAGNITDTLAEALSDKPECQRRGNNGRKLAGSFAAETVAAELITLYRSLIGSHC